MPNNEAGFIVESAGYFDTQDDWEGFSSLRTRPRRLLADYFQKDEYLFPTSKQPLLVHPLLKDIKEQDKQYILTQTLYRHLNDIAEVELKIINNVSSKISKNIYKYQFSEAIRHDLLSVVIDESYHAYVGRDFIRQVAQKTGILPLELPDETELSYAIRRCKEIVPESIHDEFDLVTVCLSEYALTTDIYNMAREKGVNKAFLFIMKDHALDEGRHAKIFLSILTNFWEILPSEIKDQILSVIPAFFNYYLTTHIHKDFDTRILQNLSYDEKMITTIIEDTHVGYSVEDLKKNSVIKAVIDLLKKTKMFQNPLIENFFGEAQLNTESITGN